MNYQQKLKSPKWQRKRLEIFNRDNFTCRLCSDTETELQVHHTKYTGKEPHNEPSKNLVTLCSDCHQFIEQNKKRYLINFDDNNHLAIKFIDKNFQYLYTFVNVTDKFADIHFCFHSVYDLINKKTINEIEIGVMSSEKIKTFFNNNF